MKVKILKCVMGGILPLVLLVACNSSKDVERTPDDHETVMNTSPGFTIPTDSSTAKKDSVRFPPPTNPDSNRTPPRKN